MITKKTSKRYFELLILLFVFLILLVGVFRYLRQLWWSTSEKKETLAEEHRLYQRQLHDQDEIRAWLSERYQHYLKHRHETVEKPVPSDDTPTQSKIRMMDQLVILQSKIEVYESYGSTKEDSVIPEESWLRAAWLHTSHVPDSSKEVSREKSAAMVTAKASVVSAVHSGCDRRLDAGTILPAVLLSGVYSAGSGLIKAQVSRDVYDSLWQHTVLIPKGTVLLGKYETHTEVAQKRLYVQFYRLIFPDGRSKAIPSAYGAHDDASAGIPAQVNTHFWTMFGSALAISTVAALVQAHSGVSAITIQTKDRELSVGAPVASGFEQTVRSILERNKNIQPTLFLSPGTVFHSVVIVDMCFS